MDPASSARDPHSEVILPTISDDADTRFSRRSSVDPEGCVDQGTVRSWSRTSGAHRLNDTATYTTSRAIGLSAIAAHDIRLDQDRVNQKRLRRQLYRAIRLATLVGADAVAIALAFASVHWWPVLPGVPWSGLRSLLPAVAVGILSLGAAHTYASGNDRRDVWRVAKGLGFAGLLLLVMGNTTLQPSELLIAVPLAWILVSVERLSIEVLVRQARKRGYHSLRAVAIGTREETERFVSTLHALGRHELRVVGHISVDELHVAGADFGRETVRRFTPDVIVVLGSHDIAAKFPRAIDALLENGVSVQIPTSVFSSKANFRASLVRSCDLPCIEYEKQGLSIPQMGLKRALDIAGAALGLLVMAPVIGLLALLIKLDTPGPVFIGQWRVGLGGRPFRMWKLRSMTADADARKGELSHLVDSGDLRLWKIKNDPRVTTVGRFIRRYSLDELPQLWNVLLGNMSLVGPRPFFEHDLASYEARHFERLRVLPGITGLWQVSGRSDITDFERVVSLDVEYIANWTLALDLEILGKTVSAVVRRNGAV